MDAGGSADGTGKGQKGTGKSSGPPGEAASGKGKVEGKGKGAPAPPALQQSRADFLRQKQVQADADKAATRNSGDGPIWGWSTADGSWRALPHRPKRAPIFSSSITMMT